MLDTPTTLWKIRRGSEELECLVRLMPHGIEVDLARDGRVTVTRTFETDQEALAWAEAKRSARAAEGWVAVPGSGDTSAPSA